MKTMLIAIMVVVAACGDDAQMQRDAGALDADADVDAPGDAPGPAIPVARYVYSVQLGGVNRYRVEAGSGKLLPAGFTLLPAADYSSKTALDPSGRFLLVSTASELNVLVIDPITGELTHAPGSPHAVSLWSFGISGDGAYVFASMPDNTLRTYALASTGALTQNLGAPSTAGVGTAVVAHPTAKLVFVSTYNLGSQLSALDAFVIGTDGTLTRAPGFPISPTAGELLGDLTISPDGARLAFTQDTSSLHVMNVDATTAALTPVSGSPRASAAALGYGLAFSPTGTRLYVGSSSNQIEGLAIDATTGAISTLAGSPFLTGSDLIPWRLAFDASGSTAFVADRNARTTTFAVDPAGALTRTTTIHGWFPSDPAGLYIVHGTAAVTASPRFVFAWEPGFMHAYAMDPTSGSLTEVGQPLATAVGVRQLAVRPGGDLLYGADTSGGLYGWMIGGNGALQSHASFPYGVAGGLRSVAMSPHGRSLLVTCTSAGDNSLVLALAADGTVTGQQRVNNGATLPIRVDTPPTGGLAWTLDQTSSTLAADFVPPTGAPTDGPTPLALGASTNPAGLAFSPDGRHGYVVLKGSSQLRAFVNAPTNAAPTPIATYAAGTAPQAVAVHPSGRFVYVANSGGSSVLAFARDEATGALTALSPASTTCLPAPVAIEVDASGKFVVVAAAGVGSTPSTGGLSVLPINANGSLGTAVDLVLPGGADALALLGSRE